jgi:hypothetical protein
MEVNVDITKPAGGITIRCAGYRRRRTPSGPSAFDDVEARVKVSVALHAPV